MHLVQHGEAGAHGEALVVQEAGHVGIGGNDPLLTADNPRVKVGGDEDDTMHYLALHQLFGFLQRGAVSEDFAFAGGVHLLQIAPAVGAAGEVYHRNGHIVHRAVHVDEVVEHGVQQTAHEEDDHHSSIGKNELEFMDKDAVPVAQPQADIVSLFHSFDSHKRLPAFS